MDKIVKVAIVGAGPAGIAAGIFLQRAGLSPLLLEKGEPGGLLRSANLVENYPGFPKGVSGRVLASRFRRQLRAVGLEAVDAQVERIARSRGSFKIDAKSQSFASRAVIVASGTRPKDPDLGSCVASRRSRVFNEITDIPRAMLRGKHAVIIGGGDAAFDYALNLRASGDGVTIVSKSGPRCLPLLRERANSRGVQTLVGFGLGSIHCTDRGRVLICRLRGDGKTEELKADFILTACGRVPNLGFLGPALAKALGTRPPPETAVKGLFVAGDAARGSHRQTGIAVGDGIRAAMMVQDLFRQRGASR